MSRVHSDPDNPRSLPDVEVFHMSAQDFLTADSDTWMHTYLADRLGPEPDDEERVMQAEDLAGWYWWTCLPGCLPDSNALGPFKTEQEAIDDAQNQ